jgi:hypothetical protein
VVVLETVWQLSQVIVRIATVMPRPMIGSARFSPRETTPALASMPRLNGDAAGAWPHERHLVVHRRAVVLVQTLLAPRAVVDAPVALAILTLGVDITVAPSAVPGLT